MTRDEREDYEWDEADRWCQNKRDYEVSEELNNEQISQHGVNVPTVSTVGLDDC